MINVEDERRVVRDDRLAGEARVRREVRLVRAVADGKDAIVGPVLLDGLVVRRWLRHRTKECINDRIRRCRRWHNPNHQPNPLTE